VNLPADTKIRPINGTTKVLVRDLPREGESPYGRLVSGGTPTGNVIPISVFSGQFFFESEITFLAPLSLIVY
jgi:hypothetical protein